MNKSVLVEELKEGMTVIRNNGMAGKIVRVHPIEVNKNKGQKIITDPIQVSFTAPNGTRILVE